MFAETAHQIAPALADGDEANVLALFFERLDKVKRFANNVDVIRARQTAVGGEQNDRDRFDLGALFQQRMQQFTAPRFGSHILHHFARFFGIVAAGERRLLRAAHFCRRDHFHRARDLGDIFDAANTLTNLT